MTTTETEVKALLDSRSAAFRDRDIERVMAIYDPEVAYFDLVPPLRYVGAVALRDRFADWFARWQTPIGQELRDLDILAGGDVAGAHMLIPTSGTLKTGQQVGYWVRTSNVCRRSNGRWLITHEHVSLPVDMKAGRPVLDLVP